MGRNRIWRAAVLAVALAGCLWPMKARAQGATVVPAALRSLSPSGVRRGATATLALSGVNISHADMVIFDDPAISGRLAPPPDPVKERGRMGVQVAVSESARIGIHRLYLRTPMGTTGALAFAVGSWPEVPEKEPNDDPARAPEISLPATLIGAIERPGDLDCFRFRARAGQEILFQVVAGPIRSRLNPVLSVLDERGAVLAESGEEGGSPDTVLGYRFERDGTYAIRVRDFENASGGDVAYRLNVGEFAYVTSVFPPGVPAGATTEVEVRGFGLGGAQRVRVTAPAAAGYGQTVPLPIPGLGDRLLNTPRLAVGSDPEVVESGDASDAPSGAELVPVPVAINGRIKARSAGGPASGGDADCYRFHARKGESLVLEVMARRLGSPLDSFIEVLRPDGSPVERATLRCVAQTVTTLSDRDSASRGLRLLSWADLKVNDLVYLRGEVLRISALPRGPDDDVVFEGLRGQRIGFLDTTPHGHSIETPVYKVRVYPPGRTFPPNGMPVFHLYNQNDDGGPLCGKDSRLTFTPPADGDYVVRIRDVRGQGGERYTYRLSIHPPRPDYRLSISPDRPNIPRGVSIPVEATADRYDGFDGEIQVRLEGLPPGFAAEPAVIAPGEASATLTIAAAGDAATPDAAACARVRLVGRALVEGKETVRTAEPDNPLLTPLPPPDVTVSLDAREVVMQPGSQVVATVRIERHNGFAGRVPIEVRNLPYGVRVLDVGLNGVLITEQETGRRFTLVAEPWVRPQSRPFYAVATVESDPASQISAAPVTLNLVARQH
jgi:hypothetical protein